MIEFIEHNLELGQPLEDLEPLLLKRNISEELNNQQILNNPKDVKVDEKALIEAEKAEKNNEFFDFFGPLGIFDEELIEIQEKQALFLNHLKEFQIEDESTVLTPEELLIRKREQEHHAHLLEFLEGYFIDHEKDVPELAEIMKEKYKIELLHGFQEIPFVDTYDFDKYHISCKICLKISPDYHILDCNHEYCTDCLTLFFYSLLDQCKIFAEDLKCPECEAKINEKLFFRHLKHEDEQKIEGLRYKFKVQRLVAEKKAIGCPVPDCVGFAHLIEGEKITACNKCKCSLCTACGLDVHPNLTCEENLEQKDDSLDRLLLSQNWKKCPTCGVPVEKISGCQFLYCTSPICKGNKNLCFLCGKFLTEALHHSHYKTKGPYGDSCNTLDGIPEDIKI